MKRTGKRTYSWVYRNKITDELVLVMKPYKRSIGGSYKVLAGIFKRAGFRPDQYLGCSSRSYDRTEFLQRFEYVGGLNTGRKPDPVELQFESRIYGGSINQSQHGHTTLSLNLGQSGELVLPYNQGVIRSDEIEKLKILTRDYKKVTITIKEQV